MLGETEVVALVQGLSRRRLRQWVQAGWVLPAQGEGGSGFSEIDVARARLILHLQRELKIGADAVPIVLSLMDQVYGLRQELRRLARAVEAQPDAVKQAILRSAGGL
jgi:chaperone modulatory protein CbpM